MITQVHGDAGIEEAYVVGFLQGAGRFESDDQDIFVASRVTGILLIVWSELTRGDLKHSDNFGSSLVVVNLSADILLSSLSIGTSCIVAMCRFNFIGATTVLFQ